MRWVGRTCGSAEPQEDFRRATCLAATSSHVFESIRKTCYYKISPVRLEFTGSYVWVVLGVTPPPGV